MKKMIVILLVLASFVFLMADDAFVTDTFQTCDGDVEMTWYGHASLKFEYNGKVIYVDPVGRQADFSKEVKADLILITHQHGDHLDADVIHQLSQEKTSLICSESCLSKISEGIVMKNGDTKEIYNISIEAVPAYNIIQMRDNGKPWHPKGVGNGYVLTFGDKHFYVAGDTEVIPEMKDLKDIDVAFLPVRIPYTMSPEMFVEAVEMLSPEIVYPYHLGSEETAQLKTMIKDLKSDIRIE